MNKSTQTTTSQKTEQPITSMVSSDGILYELLYDSKNMKSSLIQYKKGHSCIQNSFTEKGNQIITPYSPHNPLLSQKLILFPEKIEEYGDEGKLLTEIQSFIHRYVDVTETFELVATYYVLLSWVFDTFNEIPYLKCEVIMGVVNKIFANHRKYLLQTHFCFWCFNSCPQSFIF